MQPDIASIKDILIHLSTKDSTNSILDIRNIHQQS